MDGFFSISLHVFVPLVDHIILALVNLFFKRTLSDIYILGSIRHHKVPPCAIPCLYQKRLINEEETNAKAQKEYEEKLEREAPTDKSSAVMHEINAPMIKVKDSKDAVDGDLSVDELHQYATKAFEFTTIKYRRYKEWKDARKHFKDIKKLNSDKARLLTKNERPG